MFRKYYGRKNKILTLIGITVIIAIFARGLCNPGLNVYYTCHPLLDIAYTILIFIIIAEVGALIAGSLFDLVRWIRSQKVKAS